MAESVVSCCSVAKASEDCAASPCAGRESGRRGESQGRGGGHPALHPAEAGSIPRCSGVRDTIGPAGDPGLRGVLGRHERWNPRLRLRGAGFAMERSALFCSGHSHSVAQDAEVTTTLWLHSHGRIPTPPLDSLAGPKVDKLLWRQLQGPPLESTIG